MVARSMLALGLRFALAATLVAASALKLAAPRATQAALSTFGLRRGWTRRCAWVILVAVELALAVAVGAGSAAGAYAAAAYAFAGAAALAVALVRGRAGAPCGCFGARSRVGAGGVARNLVLAAGFAALPSAGSADLELETALAIGVVIALLAVVGLAVAVLALAREVGELRLRLAPQTALEVPHEGPELGSRTTLIERFDLGPRPRIALAVFTSDSCPVCRALEPALALLRRDPLVATGSFDEERDADAWRALDVPGSPYAVALALDGTVLAKGTFNTLAQLESVVATAEWRAREAVGA